MMFRLLSKLRLSKNIDKTPSEAHTLPGHDSESLVAETPVVAIPEYVYYRVYAEDGVIPSNTPAAPGDPFIGRIKSTSLPPPHVNTSIAIKRGIANVENIKDHEGTSSLFLTAYSQSPMGDADKVTILNHGTGPGFTPPEPLAFIANVSYIERSALKSRRSGQLESAAGPDTEIRYLYYQLYVDGYEKPSKAAFDPEKPSLGRIRADYITPPHSPANIKLSISRVEGIPELAYTFDTNLLADISCTTPFPKDGHISIFRTNCPGLSPKKPMVIVAVVQMTLLMNGRYLIKNRARDIYWNFQYPKVNLKRLGGNGTRLEDNSLLQWDITNCTNGNINIKSIKGFLTSWVGFELELVQFEFPWRLIQAEADSKFYYLTQNMNRLSQNPRVPATQQVGFFSYLFMTTLVEGDQAQMWEFIRV